MSLSFSFSPIFFKSSLGKRFGLLGLGLLWVSCSNFIQIQAGEEKPVPSAATERRDLHLYMKGRHVYQKFCVDCHGTTGRGNGPWSVGLETKPRNFRTGLYKFRTTAYGTLPVDDDLIHTIRSGISGTAMPVFANLQDEEVLSLVYYLKSLSRAWKDPEVTAKPIELPKAPPAWFSSKTDLAPHVKAGGERYQMVCAVCHGETGKGDGIGGKGLLDAWESPITPAALAAEHHKSGDQPLDLYRSIATGLNGTPMVGFAETFKEDEIWELVAWIYELGEQAAARGDRPVAPVVTIPKRPEEISEPTSSANGGDSPKATSDSK